MRGATDVHRARHGRGGAGSAGIHSVVQELQEDEERMLQDERLGVPVVRQSQLGTQAGVSTRRREVRETSFLHSYIVGIR